MTTRRLAWIVAVPVLLLGGIPLALSVAQGPDEEARPSPTPEQPGLRAITQQPTPEPTPTPEPLPSAREASTDLSSKCEEQEELDDNIVVHSESHDPRFPLLLMRLTQRAEKVVRGHVEYIGPERRTSEILTYQEPLEGTQIPRGRDELYCTGYFRTASIHVEQVLKDDTPVGNSETVHYLTRCSGCHSDRYVSLSLGQELYAFLDTPSLFGDRQGFRGRETGVWPLGTSDGEPALDPGFRPSGTPPMPIQRFEALVTCVTDPGDDCEDHLDYSDS